jgi:hypothetical protein
MTRSVRKIIFVAFAASFFAFPSPSHAFRAEARQMCTGDAFRLCSAEIPNVTRVTPCMLRRGSSPSGSCGTVMGCDLSLRSSNVASR